MACNKQSCPQDERVIIFLMQWKGKEMMPKMVSDSYRVSIVGFRVAYIES